jgi:hypothetical protein
MTPGIYPNLPMAEYLAAPAMSASGLRLMRQSPAHYYGAVLDPERPPPAEPSPQMRNGTMVHCATFEPAALAQRYVERPDGIDYRTKDGKAWRDAQTAEIVEPAALETALAQAASLRRHPDIAGLLHKGLPEVSAFWRDEETGVLCKCRPDWVYSVNSGVILVDGKTCRDASRDGFARQIWQYRYDLAAAWYSDGWQAAGGAEVKGYVFACVESAWPHVAAGYMLADDELDNARAEYRRLLHLYADCVRQDRWPGYQTGIQQINLPRWAAYQQEISE